MPLFDPAPGSPDVLNLLEELGLQVSEAYTIAELRLLKVIFDRIDQNLDVTDQIRHVQAINDLALQARRILADVDVDRLVADVIETAVTQGELAATARLRLAPAINTAPAAGFSAQQAQLVASIGAQLQGGLTAMAPRILRSVQDVYQRVVGEAIQQQIITQSSRQVARRDVVQNLLGQGLTGFTDKAGRNWHLGTYADMATRTAASNAYDQAHMARMNASGIELFTIVVGVGADKVCADWANKILSNDGRTGPVEVQNALTGQLTTVTVQGTLDEARAAGWKHPNCRCTVVGYMAGLSIPADLTTYDPVAEKARTRLRELERRKRALLAQQEFAPDDIAKAQAKRQVTAANKAIRDHVEKAKIPRSPGRETLAYQNGKVASPKATPTPTRPSTPKPTAPTSVRPQTTQPSSAKPFPKPKLNSEEESRVTYYTGQGSSELNSRLRNGTASIADQQAKIGLNKIIDKSPIQAPVTVFRGSIPLDGVKAGDQITEAGFSSTSLKAGTAKTYAGINGAVYEIQVPKGASALNTGLLSSNPTEGEVLLKAGSKFEVVSVSKIKGQLGVTVPHYVLRLLH